MNQFPFTRLLLPLSIAGAALVYAISQRRVSRLAAGQVAIITGGSSGLGLALAHELGRAGLKLVLASREEGALEAARTELLSSGSVQSEDDVLIVVCDVSDRNQAARLIRRTVKTFRALDLLINDAGIIEVGPVESQSIDTFERSMAINFFGAVNTVFAALPYLLKKKNGAIVNISSIGGKIPAPHLLPYVASKFALTGFSEGLHVELRSKGIHVTTVCPGLMRTGGESHAHFSGNVEAEKAWFQTSARTPLLSADVHRAAKHIVNAVTARQAEITITPQAWLAARLFGLAPETLQIIASLINEYVLPESSGSQTQMTLS